MQASLLLDEFLGSSTVSTAQTYEINAVVEVADIDLSIVADAVAVNNLTKHVDDFNLAVTSSIHVQNAGSGVRVNENFAGNVFADGYITTVDGDASLVVAHVGIGGGATRTSMNLKGVAEFKRTFKAILCHFVSSQNGVLTRENSSTTSCHS